MYNWAKIHVRCIGKPLIHSMSVHVRINLCPNMEWFSNRQTFYLKLYFNLLGSDGDKAIGFKYLYLEQIKSYKCHYKHCIMTVLLFNMAVNEIIRDQAKMSWNSLFVIKCKCFILFSLIIQGGDDRRVVVWNVEKCVYGSGSPVVMKGEHRSNIFCTVFDNDNTHIYSAGTRSTLFYQLKID